MTVERSLWQKLPRRNVNYSAGVRLSIGVSQPLRHSARAVGLAKRVLEQLLLG